MYILQILGKLYMKKNRKNSVRAFKRLECSEFIRYVVDKIKNYNSSPDACFGETLIENKFDRSNMVCTKTLYNCIDLGLLDIKSVDLPYKLRRNTKPSRVRKNKRVLVKDPLRLTRERNLGIEKLIL